MHVHLPMLISVTPQMSAENKISNKQHMNINDTMSVIIPSTATHVRDGQIKYIIIFFAAAVIS